jgi:hypothetical protein
VVQGNQDIPFFSHLSDHEDPPAPTPTYASPPSTIDMISRVQPKHKRDRSWDRVHPSRRFRRVDPDLVAGVANIARDQNLTQYEVAQVLLEFGFDSYEKGLLKLDPDFEGSRRTLYPDGDDGKPKWRYVPGGWGNSKVETKKRSIKKTVAAKKDWELTATWRLSDDLFKKLKWLSETLHVPMGDVVTLLGKFSLEIYGNGELIFESSPFYRQSGAVKS